MIDTITILIKKVFAEVKVNLISQDATLLVPRHKTVDTINQNKLVIVLASLILLFTCGFIMPEKNEFRSFQKNAIEYETADLQYRVSEDKIPPTVVLSISAPTGNNGWYNAPIFVSVISFDGGSGIATSQISLGGGTWYKNAMMIRNDGTYRVMASAVDRAGNRAGAFAIVKVDMTPPDVEFIYPEPDGDHGYYVDEVPIVLTGVDVLSGVVDSKINVKVNSLSTELLDLDVRETFSFEKGRYYQRLIQGKNISTETVRVTLQETGDYSIQGYVEDEAGNRTLVSKQIAVDRNAPQISIASPKEYQDDIQLFGDVRDEDSGIFQVMIDYGFGWNKVGHEKDKWTIMWPAGELVEGKYPIKAKVIDMAGNETIAKYNATVLNTVWPFITLSGLLIAIALFYVLDPRRNEWTRLTVQIDKYRRMYKNGLEQGIEEDFIND